MVVGFVPTKKDRRPYQNIKGGWLFESLLHLCAFNFFRNLCQIYAVDSSQDVWASLQPHAHIYVSKAFDVRRPSSWKSGVKSVGFLEVYKINCHISGHKK